VTVRNLEFLFRPRTVALVGASDREGSVGSKVVRNLLDAGFEGAIWPVNPKHSVVAGLSVYGTVADLPAAPDLAVICTPPATVPKLIAELGERGTRAAIVLTAGLAQGRTEDGRTFRAAMLDAARPHLLRILGPNCVGLVVPGMKLNASFAPAQALPGKIAFVSQSGALATAMLDWARSNGVGFSHFISLGDSADVDFGDVLDYLASDPDTRSILLYIESVTAARKFMSAARAAARNKPVIAVKAGRVPEGARAATSHTGALAGSDDVYDAPLARAAPMTSQLWRYRRLAQRRTNNAAPILERRLCFMRFQPYNAIVSSIPMRIMNSDSDRLKYESSPQALCRHVALLLLATVVASYTAEMGTWCRSLICLQSANSGDARRSPPGSVATLTLTSPQSVATRTRSRATLKRATCSWRTPRLVLCV
jgi:acetyltransferase